MDISKSGHKRRDAMWHSTEKEKKLKEIRKAMALDRFLDKLAEERLGWRV